MWPVAETDMLLMPEAKGVNDAPVRRKQARTRR
jgi:hypothetical protein